MPHTSYTAEQALELVGRNDPTLNAIDLFDNQLTDAELSALVDYLLIHPDVVKYLYLGRNQLTDETGVKLARFVATSSTIEFFFLHNNQIGDATYLALATALRVNTSLRYLALAHNQTMDRTRIDDAFIDALILNPKRRIGAWWLYYKNQDEFQRLKAEAEQRGHPTMQSMLSTHLLRSELTA